MCSLVSPPPKTIALDSKLGHTLTFSFWNLGVSTTCETLNLFNCQVQDDKFGLLVMRGCGGRGGAALLAWMVALLFYNTNEAVCLLNVNEAADEILDS